MQSEVKVRNSFGTGFGIAFGCLTAIVVFFFGGCVLMIGSCATAADTAVRNAPSNPPIPVPNPPASTSTIDPTVGPETSGSDFKYETISVWDNDEKFQNQTVFVENPTRANIAEHALRLKNEKARWIQINYYDNRAGTPRLKTGTPLYLPDSSYPYMVANFLCNPFNGHIELMFRKDVPVGEATTGDVAELMRISETLADLEDDEISDPATVFTLEIIGYLAIGDNEVGQLHLHEAVYVEHPTKADIAEHIETVRAGWTGDVEINYFNDRAATPRVENDTPPGIPDSSRPNLVASYTSNELLFRDDVPVGGPVWGEAEQLVRMSGTLAKWQIESNAAKPPHQYQRAPTTDQQKEERDKRAAAALAKIENALFRTWKSTSGTFSIEAKIISFAFGTVTLETRQGKRIKVPQDKLSPADQVFIDRWRHDPR